MSTRGMNTNIKDITKDLTTMILMNIAIRMSIGMTVGTIIEISNIDTENITDDIVVTILTRDIIEIVTTRKGTITTINVFLKCYS